MHAHTHSHTRIYTLNSGIHSEPQMLGCWAVIWRPESDWIMTTKNSFPFWVSRAGCQSWHLSHLIPAAALLVRNSQFTFTEEEAETVNSCKTGTASPLSFKFNSWHAGWHPVNVCWMTTPTTPVSLQHKVLMIQKVWWGLPLSTSVSQKGWHSSSKPSLCRNIRFWLLQAWYLATGTNRWRELWYLSEENLMERQFSLPFDMLLFLKFKIIICHWNC